LTPRFTDGKLISVATEPGDIMQASKELFRQYLGSEYRKLMSFRCYLVFIGSGA
jgi:hypothetical protein